MRAFHAIAVVPARMDSRRLPGKLLLAETGKPLIRHTLLRVNPVATPYVVTDSDEIAAAVADTAVVVRTGPACSGTDRVAQAHAAGLLPPDSDVDLILHVQADEPEIETRYLERLVRAARLMPADCDLATLSAPLLDPLDQFNPHVVKVQVGPDGCAVAFCRGLLPGARRHVGIYAYRPSYLGWWAGSRPIAVEQQEQLEQLRPMAWDKKILVVECDHPYHGIDTREQYHEFVRREALR